VDFESGTSSKYHSIREVNFFISFDFDFLIYATHFPLLI
jgi:hypothetical protein